MCKKYQGIFVRYGESSLLSAQAHLQELDNMPLASSSNNDVTMKCSSELKIEEEVVHCSFLHARFKFCTSHSNVIGHDYCRR